MRRMLYLGLTEALKELKDDGGQPLIRHIDLWNEQVEFIEQEEPFDTPAVFIEFRPVQWRTLGGPPSRQTFRSGCMWSRNGKEVQGTEACFRKNRWNVLICWIRLMHTCSTSSSLSGMNLSA